MSRIDVRRALGVCVWLLACATVAAQDARIIVVDQTGLPLPGVTIQLLNGETVVTTLTTDAAGTIAIDPALAGETIVASLDGFETARVGRATARIELKLAHAEEQTTVVGTLEDAATSPTAAVLGSTLTATNVARLPSTQMKPRESLPLLPSVVRGPDGLMQLGGARASDTPLTVDGFNVTDPASGVSSINLPFEAVRGIEAMRDPMAVTYGGLVGGLVRMESKPGGDDFEVGVQGFVPRPRFSSPGFGRLEGIFPRAYIAGASADRRLRYRVAGEYDYERIPVPDVTSRTGQDLIEISGIFFSRFDVQWSSTQATTFEGFAAPAHTQNWGLSPRRDVAATVDVNLRDLFGGVTHRSVTSVGVFTIQVGMLAREADLAPRTSGASQLSPDGWAGGWFSTVHRNSGRYTIGSSWERVLKANGRAHDLTVSSDVATRWLTGRVSERGVEVVDQLRRRVRSVEFGPTAAFDVRDSRLSLAFRDVWHATSRTQVDGGVRIDHDKYAGGDPSARIGVRHALNAAGTTVVKAGVGRFIGTLPLAIVAFGAYPLRVDRWIDPDDGSTMRELVYQPGIGALRLPRATAIVGALEHQITPGLDAQVAFTTRGAENVATLRVPLVSGPLRVSSDGHSRYREIQLSARRTWSGDQQIFASYVLASAYGELNEFNGIFQMMDAPLVQPGGMTRTANEVRHRVLTWGTFNLPARVVVSPVGEWRSGFPYSPLNVRYHYDGVPNSRAFPAFMAIDAVVYKTLTVKKRTADLGIQLFNLTNHKNPRDVYPVAGFRQGDFTNSVGTIVRGYMLIKW